MTGGVADAPLPRWVVPCIFLFAVFLRVAVSLHPYSGEGRPPMFGDYEAQRHWMEITLHTPLGEWYRQTPSNDLGYWGLDYPPLTAYQSWAYGRVVASFEPAAVALGTSRGYETSSSRLLMRWSVVASDLIFFFPGVYAFIRAFYAARETPARTSWALAAALVAPAGVLIDHGHFQYNGKASDSAAAAAAVVSDRDLLGAALFSLALNHKQMSLYYAPAFFAHMLGKCLRRDTRAGRALRDRETSAPSSSASSRSSGHLSPSPKAPMVSRTPAWGVFSPSCAASRRSSGAYTRITSPTFIARRIRFFDGSPFRRASPPDWRWRSRSPRSRPPWRTRSHSRARRVSCGASPTPRGRFSCSVSRRTRSPRSCRSSQTRSSRSERRSSSRGCPRSSAFLAWPLLRRDGLAVAYVASVAVFCALVGGGAPGKKADEKRSGTLSGVPWTMRLATTGGIATAAIAHLAAATIPPPRAYPHLHDLIFSVLSFAASRAARWRRPTGDSGRRRGAAGRGARGTRKRTSSDALR